MRAAMSVKNLRSVVIYLTGITVVCLMIEVSKRRSELLDAKLYEVKIAKDSELSTDPAEDIQSGLVEEDIIPKRNRGKESPITKRPRTPKQYNYESNHEKEDFKKWKASIHIKPGEGGLFKRWKALHGLTKSKNKKDEKRSGNSWKNAIVIDPDKGVLEDVYEETDSKDIPVPVKADITENNDLSKDSQYKVEPINVGKKERKKAKPRRVKPARPPKEKVPTKEKTEAKGKVDAKQAKERAEIKAAAEKKSQKKAALEVDREEDEDYDDDYSEEHGDFGNSTNVFPKGVIEYDPPDSQHSCTDFRMTQTLLDRKSQVADACTRLQSELGYQRRLYSRLRWAVPERLLYCPVFKAASTSWLINYLKLANSTADPKSGNLHKLVTRLFPAPRTLKLRKRIYEESTKFIIVRHPFERLVSAYRDKLAGFTRNEHYLAMRKHIIATYRENEEENSLIPTFRESIDFVLDELEKLNGADASKSERKRDSLIDGHFMPYSSRCLPCVMDYDVIIKFETLEEDSKYLIEECGLEGHLEVKHENPAPTGPRTNQGYKNKSKKVKKGLEMPQEESGSSYQTLSFFKDISSSKIEKLYEYYKYDFDIFGYSSKEYLSV